MEENNMNFPLKNKEELDESGIMTVSKRKYNTAIWTAVISAFVTIAGIIAPLVFDFAKSEEKQMLKDAAWQQKVDSIISKQNDLNDRKIQQQTYRNISRVNEYMNQLRKELPKSSGISLYYTHDSGGVPVSGSPLNVTILYSANNDEPCLGKSYWQNEPLPEGYFNYNYRLYQQRFIYLEDVTQETEIYSSDTKEQIDCNRTRGMMGILLKETSTGAYFVSVGWKEVDPLKNNYSAKIILRKYAAKIRPLIQGKKSRKQ